VYPLIEGRREVACVQTEKTFCWRRKKSRGQDVGRFSLVAQSSISRTTKKGGLCQDVETRCPTFNHGKGSTFSRNKTPKVGKKWFFLNDQEESARIPTSCLDRVVLNVGGGTRQFFRRGNGSRQLGSPNLKQCVFPK